MSTYLANLATRAIGASSLNRSRLLRPLVPSIFGSSAVEPKPGTSMEFPQDGVRSVAKAQAPKAPTHVFDPARHEAGVESQTQRWTPDPARTNSQPFYADSEDVLLSATSLKSTASETGLSHPDVRRDAAFVVEEPAGPPLLSESKTAVYQKFRSNTSEGSRIDSKDEKRQITPEWTAQSANAREQETDAQQTASRSGTFIPPNKLNAPAGIFASTAKPGDAAVSHPPKIDRDINVTPLAPLRDLSSTVPYTSGAAKGEASNRLLENLRTAKNEGRVATPSIGAGHLVSTSGENSEALRNLLPMRAKKEAAVEGSAANGKTSGSSNFAGARDRSTSVPIVQNRPPVPGALRSLTQAQHPGAPTPQKIVEVHIGRVEVRAPSQSSSGAAARESSQTPSLDDYLRGRTGRGVHE